MNGEIRTAPLPGEESAAETLHYERVKKVVDLLAREGCTFAEAERILEDARCIARFTAVVQNTWEPHFRY